MRRERREIVIARRSSWCFVRHRRRKHAPAGTLETVVIGLVLLALPIAAEALGRHFIGPHFDFFWYCHR